jgi:hypothetical protein
MALSHGLRVLVIQSYAYKLKGVFVLVVTMEQTMAKKTKKKPKKKAK